VLTQVIDSVEEKFELALDLAKKQYYKETHHLMNDSLLSKRQRRKEEAIEDKISTQDSAFDKYLQDKLKLPAYQLVSIQDKCIMLIGDSWLSKEVHRLMLARNQAVIDYLVKEEGLAPERVKVVINNDAVLLSHTPEPEYDIKYKAIADKE
jgi:hypothetical protein